jgi:hypothetical protein
MNTLLSLTTFSHLELPPFDISLLYLFSSMILDIAIYLIFTTIIITGISVFILFSKKVDLKKLAPPSNNPNQKQPGPPLALAYALPTLCAPLRTPFRRLNLHTAATHSFVNN